MNALNALVNEIFQCVFDNIFRYHISNIAKTHWTFNAKYRNIAITHWDSQCVFAISVCIWTLISPFISTAYLKIEPNNGSDEQMVKVIRKWRHLRNDDHLTQWPSLLGSYELMVEATRYFFFYRTPFQIWRNLKHSSFFCRPPRSLNFSEKKKKTRGLNLELLIQRQLCNPLHHKVCFD